MKNNWFCKLFGAPGRRAPGTLREDSGKHLGSAAAEVRLLGRDRNAGFEIGSGIGLELAPGAGIVGKHWFCKLFGGPGLELRLALGAELLKKHWFCKLFGGPGSEIVENHWFCKLFGGSGGRALKVVEPQTAPDI